MTNHRKLISVVSPAYNEETNIPMLIQTVAEVMLTLKDQYDHELILIDDGSQDETWEAIKNAALENSQIKGIRFTRNFGQQIALSAGIDQVSGDALIYLDSDLQHPPSLFPQLIEQWEKGAKIVHTLRTQTRNEPLLKKMMSGFFYWLANFLSDAPIEAGMADFKLLDKEVYLKLRSMGERNRFLRGMVPWLGYPSAKVLYQAPARAAGSPFYNFRRNLTFAKMGILAMSTKPLKYVGYLGAILMILSFLGLLTATISMIIKNDFRYISPTVMLSMFNTLLIGIVLSCLGVVALYISYLREEIVQRPLYVERERVNL